MAKIPLDKYYTPSELARYCVEKTKEVIGESNITEYLEPSAGAGAFLPFLDKPYTAYDLMPESEGIIEQDYTKLKIPYKKGRCVIGNPPYGKGNTLSVQFFKKAIMQGDYVSFILPISQLNNNMYMYEFDMIHSEDLGRHEYSKVEVHCCLNIYRRNPIGMNPKPIYDVWDVELHTVSRGLRNDKVPKKYDFSFCGFGAAMGKLCDREDQYCKQIYVSIKNEKYRKEITDVILNTDWYSLYSMTATPSLAQWMVYRHLRNMIPGLGKGLF